MMAASCTQEMEMDNNIGYLTLKMNTLVSTNDVGGTRAEVPEDYNAKQLHVDIIDESGETIKSTDDFHNDEAFREDIALKAGKYTIVAHSHGWDGNASGFDAPYYYGSKTTTVKPNSIIKESITCTQANVKVTVNYDPSFLENFFSATTTVSSVLPGIEPLDFEMRNSNIKPGYFPVGDLMVKLVATNNRGDDNDTTSVIRNVEARDHYIFNYKVVDSGSLGSDGKPGISVEVDGSTNTYTYTFEVSKKPGTSLVARAANAWSTFAYLNGSVTSKTNSFQRTGLKLQYRMKGADTWIDIPNNALTIDADDNISYQLKGLTPNTKYEYRVCYVEGDNETPSTPNEFITENQIALYNGGFENWWTKDGVLYPNGNNTYFWDTSNKGAADFGGTNTTESTSIVHGGQKSAKLESLYIVIKFAAASLYTGEFGALIGTKGAWLNWGQPFTARPTALKGYMQYAPKNVDRVGKNLPSGAPAKGEPDQCGMYCALLTEQLRVDNTEIEKTFPKWDGTDKRVIAYGELPMSQNTHSNGQWKEVNIPLVYFQPNVKPTHLLIVCSSSKYGDYFHGGEGSTLYLDDFELVYGDNPSIQQ